MQSWSGMALHREPEEDIALRSSQPNLTGLSHNSFREYLTPPYPIAKALSSPEK